MTSATALALALVSPAAGAGVDATRFDAFWLWAGVRPQPVLHGAKRLYLLEGQVDAAPTVRLIAQRAAIPHVAGSDIWMVVRVGTLRWTPLVYRQLLGELGRWRSAGNRVVGVQIDFDARTRHLGDYATFLSDLRARLPADCRLGITGLLDWSASGDPAGLDALASTVDEVVLQIYQGRHVIPGYAGYLEARPNDDTVPHRAAAGRRVDTATVLVGQPAVPRLRRVPDQRRSSVTVISQVQVLL